ncbi:hypothetical protein EZV73_22075 [Acidaminobacter sp. JC074]|uniref:hypothetical protein n=1 Tax=Acidaminobacter sp. JC074 TaxID=2530199 RepID=UPI001F0EBEFD|nr:hypothetical protein [Acidaminobacter sp. JC074]MCH4890286.1 hypothetical protein [Acidaminobacter sp. JC074]
MNSFKSASEYITDKTSYEVFERVAIYQVWTEFKHNKNFGHDVIATFLSCFAGPFDGFKYDPYDDPALKDIVEYTNWGWSQSWPQDLVSWAQKYCKSQEDVKHFNNIMNVLSAGKADEVYHYMHRNAQNPPTLQTYFPELVPFGQFNDSNWPRK